MNKIKMLGVIFLTILIVCYLLIPREYAATVTDSIVRRYKSLAIEEVKGTTKHYLKKKYTSKDFEIQNIYYDTQEQCYHLQTRETKEDIEFNIDVRGKDIKDFYLEEKLAKEALELILPLVKQVIPEAEVWIRVGAINNKTDKIEFTKDIKCLLFVFVNWEGQEITSNIFVDKSMEVKNKLANNGFALTQLQCLYKSGQAGNLVLTFDKYNFNLDKENLLAKYVSRN